MHSLFLTPAYGILVTMTEDIQIIKEIEKAAALCEKQYTREDIFCVLNTPSTDCPDIDVEKQICILKLDTINSQQEADLLVFHQTNHHGLIREACSQKINEFMKKADICVFFQTKEIHDTLLKAANDINPNICRAIIEILPYVNDKNYLLDKLYKRFDEVFEELEKLKRSNWYTKKLFNLYWCLEALHALNPPYDKRIENVLSKTSKFKDYTIREKTAMVLSALVYSSEVLNNIKSALKTDDNFYVRRYSRDF